MGALRAIPFRESPYGNLLYEVFLSEKINVRKFALRSIPFRESSYGSLLYEVLSRAAGPAEDQALVLLFELRLHSTCSTIYEMLMIYLSDHDAELE